MVLEIEQYHGTRIISAHRGAALVREWNACAKPGNIVPLAFMAMPQKLAPKKKPKRPFGERFGS